MNKFKLSQKIKNKIEKVFLYDYILDGNFKYVNQNLFLCNLKQKEYLHCLSFSLFKTIEKSQKYDRVNDINYAKQFYGSKFKILKMNEKNNIIEYIFLNKKYKFN